MALIKKGTLIWVNHTRKGKFKAVAAEDFDPEKVAKEDGFYPIALAEGNVAGAATDWFVGEKIPCRASLCKIVVL